MLVAAGIVAAFQVGKAPPALPSIRADFGATLEQAGWLLSVINLMTAVGGMAIALTADRLGHRRLVLAGTALCLAASLAGACVDRFGLLLLARALEGLGFIMVVAAVPSLLLRVARPSDQRTTMALWSTYMPVGAGSMMLISAVVLPDASWRAGWLVAAAAAGLMLVLLRWKAAPRTELDPAPAARRPVLTEMAEVATSGGPVAIAVCFGAYACCWYAVIGFLPTLQIERLGFATSTAAIVTAAVAMTNVFGNLLSGWLLHRGVSRLAVIGVATGSMAFAAAGIFVDGVPDLLRLALAGLYSAVIGVVPGALFTAIPLHAPRAGLAGASTGLLMQGSNTGGLLGPPITGALVAAGGWPYAAWLTSGALAIVVLAALFLHRRERRMVSR